jgi:hypothetical protein
MRDYLKYPSDKILLLQKLYRHKVVHLSQPKAVIEYNNQNIGWCHDENQPSRHLTFDLTPGIVDLYGKGKISCNGQFLVSVWQLKDDIRDSVIRQPDGYIENLRIDGKLQNRFATAINDIFNPSIIS